LAFTAAAVGAACAFCVAAACAVVVECGEGVGGHDAPFIGVCALDTAAGQLLLGAWRDDEVRRGEI